MPKGTRMLPIVLLALVAVRAEPADVSSSSIASSVTPNTQQIGGTDQQSSTAAAPEPKMQPDLWPSGTPDLVHQIHEPSSGMPYIAHVTGPLVTRPQSSHQQQPIVPAPPSNYYLPPAYASHQYPQSSTSPPPPPPTTTEFRSDQHYAYPFEPGYVATYPVAQPPLDASLVPTAKHFVIVSFIGLLLLFAVVQNSIAAIKRKDALVEVLANRDKRDLSMATLPGDFSDLTPEIESALKEDARVRCIQRIMCFENRKLLEDLGIPGKILAKYLTDNVKKYLKNLTPGWDRLVEDAAKAGLRNEDCNVVYRGCSLEISNGEREIK